MTITAEMTKRAVSQVAIKNNMTVAEVMKEIEDGNRQIKTIVFMLIELEGMV